MEAQYGTRINANIETRTWASQEGYFNSMINGVNSLYLEGSFIYDGDYDDRDGLKAEILASNGISAFSVSFGDVIKDLNFIIREFQTNKVEKTGVKHSITGYSNFQSNTLSKTILVDEATYITEYPADSIIELEKGDAVYMESYLPVYRNEHEFWKNLFFVGESGTYNTRDEVYAARVTGIPVGYDEQNQENRYILDNFSAQLPPSFSTSYEKGINTLSPRPVQLSFSNLPDKELNTLLLWLESFMGFSAKEIYIEEIQQFKRFFLDSFSIEFKDYNINTVSATFVPDFRSIE